MDHLLPHGKKVKKTGYPKKKVWEKGKIDPACGFPWIVFFDLGPSSKKRFNLILELCSSETVGSLSFSCGLAWDPLELPRIQEHFHRLHPTHHLALAKAQKSRLIFNSKLLKKADSWGIGKPHRKPHTLLFKSTPSSP